MRCLGLLGLLGLMVVIRPVQANLVQTVVAAAPSGTATYWQDNGGYTRTAARLVWVDYGSLYVP